MGVFRGRQSPLPGRPWAKLEKYGELRQELCLSSSLSLHVSTPVSPSVSLCLCLSPSLCMCLCLSLILIPISLTSESLSVSLSLSLYISHILSVSLCRPFFSTCSSAARKYVEGWSDSRGINEKAVLYLPALPGEDPRTILLNLLASESGASWQSLGLTHSSYPDPTYFWKVSTSSREDLGSIPVDLVSGH